MHSRLAFDPGLGPVFWDAIRRLPGYPHGETIRLKRMLFAPDALGSLPDILAGAGARPDRPLVVVMDETPMRRSGDDLKPTVLAGLAQAGWSIERHILRADVRGQVHTDLDRIEHVQACLREGCAVLAVGSGTVTDIAKHACYRMEQAHGRVIPFVVFQTANSVSAFTSDMAPVFVAGVKRTLPSRYPDALVCDLTTLRDAPAEMTAAGVGDLLAAGVSFADWYLAHALGLDHTYTPLAEGLMAGLEGTLPEAARGVRIGDLEAVGRLARLIALAGLAMSLSHATTPLSGFEHVFSHVLDMQAEARRQPLAVHGAQVALATWRSAHAYRLVLSELNPADIDWRRSFPDGASLQPELERAFAPMDPSGRVSSECWGDFSTKLEAWHAVRQDIRARFSEWPELREALARRVWSPDTIEHIIDLAGLPKDFPDLDPPVDARRAREAFLTAHWIRKRFTLGDLLYFVGWDRQALWERVSEAEGRASLPELDSRS